MASALLNPRLSLTDLTLLLARPDIAVRTHATDAGYLSKETVEREASAGIERVMPLPTNPGGEPAAACQPRDGPGVRAWRARMQTPDARAPLRQRSGIAETPNAELKTYRGMDRLLVRGIHKATGVVLLSVIAYNLMHFARHWWAARCRHSDRPRGHLLHLFPMREPATFPRSHPSRLRANPDWFTGSKG